jgi:hypothetical protein
LRPGLRLSWYHQHKLSLPCSAAWWSPCMLPALVLPAAAEHAVRVVTGRGNWHEEQRCRA